MMRFDRVMTPRLVLRRWQPGDLDPFAALNADPEVMRHFPSTYDREATAAMITAWEAKIDRQGFGLWAVERAEDGVLLGMAGLNPVPPGIITARDLRSDGVSPGTPGDTATPPRPVEPPSTSPVESSPVYLVVHLGGEPTLSGSDATAGVRFVRNFDHPNIPDGDPTRPHVLYMLDLAGAAPRPEL